MRDVCARILVLIASCCLFVACEDQGKITEDGTVAEWPAEPEAIPRDRDTYICDPVVDPDIGGSPSGEADPRQGVLAKLYYLSEDAPHYEVVDDYIEFGLTYDDVDIYFNQLNLPTRPFDRGFVTEAGTTMMTPEGDTLYEWFALDIHGKVHLNPDQSPGEYQFAILADDGVIMELDMDNDGVYETTIIDNDGYHPTRMGCGTQSVYFDAGTEYNFRMKYFQGPKYHISLVPMMRPLPAKASDDVDPECGKQGNSRYFDSTQSPPKPQSAYLGLLDRGWAPLNTGNYSLPDGEEDNPCEEEEEPPVAPVVSNIGVSSVGTSTAVVTWDSDILSSSQVEILDVLNGTTVYSAEDTNMVTSHSVTLTGLMSNRLYRVRGISKEPSGLSASTDTVDFRTSR